MTTAPKYLDVFNGDADGICSLHQLRLVHPRPGARLITGVKRDIRLLGQLTGTRNTEITVLDISLDSNREALNRLLLRNRVLYIDHHFCGELPASPALTARINPEPETCTSLIVDRMIGGRYRAWAAAGAYGDNLHQAAGEIAREFSPGQLAELREVGELLNYNGYGKNLNDLYFHPADLYNAIKDFSSPFDFAQNSPALDLLRQGFSNDLAQARHRPPVKEMAAGAIYRFPEERWARRVAGIFMNEKAREQEEMAHALMVDNGNGTLMVSVRAPLARRSGADLLCRRFPGGGGRPAAAGINELAHSKIEEFTSIFEEIFSP